MWFVIPHLSIALCTVKIVRALKERPRKGVRNHKKAMLVLAVLLAFMICWLTYQVLKIGAHDNFGFFNSDLNPVLYVIAGRLLAMKYGGC